VKVNDVVYTPERNVCRVMKVRDTETNPLSKATAKRRPGVQRGRFLVTYQDKQGKVRSMYDPQPVPRFMQAIMHIRKQLPQKHEPKDMVTITLTGKLDDV